MSVLLIDVFFALRWWMVLLMIGVVFLPLISVIFSQFSDRGYIFAKVLGMLFVSYIVFVLGTVKILPFTLPTILFILALLAIANIAIASKAPSIFHVLRSSWKILLFEEVLFLIGLLFWSFVRANQPDINGLEKYMDFGFINSILRSNFFPPADMWFTPLPINYYYFGHLVTAVLTKLTMIPSNITFNLMLATLFAFTFVCSFSIGMNLIKGSAPRAILAGLLSAFLVSLAGNLHAIYVFFKPYATDNPVPFWQLAFSPQTFPNGYWYPNATRFITNTIHEFPLYSFVVSDLHGHVLDIPFVLLTIAFLLSIFLAQTIRLWHTVFLGLLIAAMYMTNAWDGMIYFLLAVIVFVIIRVRLFHFLLLIGVFALFSSPFSLFFKPFASGIGVVCAPEFLTSVGKLGPFLFEKDHCLRSPLWQLLILHGFFYFFVSSLIFFLYRVVILRSEAKSDLAKPEGSRKIVSPDIFVILLIFLSTMLIIIPEFVYLKDIYPAHYRANTMFKLVYQSFIMLSFVTAYVMVRVILTGRFLMRLANAFLLFLVGIYPILAIRGYYGSLSTYRGLNGTSYVQTLSPADYEAITWLNKTVVGQPVILEAQGDSYTTFARVSANTGLPTVLGWTVHEWLWRGTYDIPSPRIADVQTLYETTDEHLAKKIVKKYRIAYVFVGSLEKQKYQKLNEKVFEKIGRVVYRNGETVIYQIKGA